MVSGPFTFFSQNGHQCAIWIGFRIWGIPSILYRNVHDNSGNKNSYQVSSICSWRQECILWNLGNLARFTKSASVCTLLWSNSLKFSLNLGKLEGKKSKLALSHFEVSRSYQEGPPYQPDRGEEGEEGQYVMWVYSCCFPSLFFFPLCHLSYFFNWLYLALLLASLKDTLNLF